MRSWFTGTCLRFCCIQQGGGFEERNFTPPPGKGGNVYHCGKNNMGIFEGLTKFYNISRILADFAPHIDFSPPDLAAFAPPDSPVKQQNIRHNRASYLRTRQICGIPPLNTSLDPKHVPNHWCMPHADVSPWVSRPGSWGPACLVVHTVENRLCFSLPDKQARLAGVLLDFS